MLRRGVAFLLFCLVLATGPAVAQDRSLEYGVKANYLVRFVAFVEWPSSAFADAASPVVICVRGRDPFGGALDRAAAGQSVRGRAVRIQRIGALQPDSLCHLAYLGSASQSVEAALQATEGRPTLLVTDEAVGPARGAVHFAVLDGRVRFHINERVAHARGLAINTRMLALALSVVRP